MFSISEASEALGVTSHTLRYYEKEGIITPNRSSTGIRSYTDSHLKWLKFVMKLRETKMPISTIKDYTGLVMEGNHTRKERLTLLEEHQKNIQQQIEILLSTNEMLNDKIGSYKKALAE
ncbi:MerR family transcriptional regulator [Rossellomorea vietnamensis]|uniref:MerR family transcriptional regulator n=1 Tax=Rossellomorea vietnamensis TaxID=218284 RepID=A0A0P6WV35_9BACI|nr:MerR family transcriptional regulator [Rossellomorea vietnamensis]KPL60163.1 MerR family transcriptional regulator [Rossellomorea vietnamensis]